jgi:hypothetical protein
MEDNVVVSEFVSMGIGNESEANQTTEVAEAAPVQEVLTITVGPGSTPQMHLPRVQSRPRGG